MRKLAVALALGALVTTAVGSVQGAEDMSTREWFQVMDQRYEQFIDKWPVAKNTSGTGFKPYMRFKTFYEKRLDEETGSMIPGVRWEAYQQLQAMIQDKGQGGDTWFTLGPTNVAGRCLAVEVHPENSNIVFAGFASGGLWRTTDAGSSWTPITDYLPTLSIGAIEIDVNNPDHMWIATGEGWGNVDAVHGVGLLESNDGGDTFELTSLSYDIALGVDMFEIEHNPATGTIVVGADNGLWRSGDGGETWDEVMTVGQWKDVELKRGSTDTYFACAHALADAGFYVSTDDGMTWNRVANGTPGPQGLGNMRFALTDADPNTIYWGIASPSGGQLGIWKSTNGASSFSQIYFPGANHYGQQGWYDLTISVDPEDPDRVWSGGVFMFRSTNGGSSFGAIGGNVHVDHHATNWDPSDPNTLWWGCDGGVYKSSTSGETFIGRNIGLVTLQYYAMNQCESLATRAVGGTQDNGTWVYNGNQNHSSVLGGDGFQCECDHNLANYVYAELYYGEHYRSQNGGPGMSPINNGINQAGPWETPTHCDYGNPSHLYTVHSSRIFKTTNRGGLWTQVHDGTSGAGVSIHQCRNSPSTVAAISALKVWVSQSSGNNGTWVDKTGDLTSGGRLSDIAVHPDDPNTMLVTLSTYSSGLSQIQKTTNGGVNWVPIDAGLPDEPLNSVEIDPSNPDWYFVGSDMAVYVSFNAGVSWLPLNVGLPHVVVEDVRLHDSGRFLRVGTHGRGMWELDISNLSPSAVDDVDEVAVSPIKLRVLGNPASDVVTLNFGLRRPGHASLGIYDVSGRLIRQLFDREAEGAADNVDVDLTDLPGGVYFARLDANGATLSRKIVVER